MMKMVLIDVSSHMQQMLIFLINEVRIFNVIFNIILELYQ